MKIKMNCVVAFRLHISQNAMAGPRRAKENLDLGIGGLSIGGAGIAGNKPPGLPSSSGAAAGAARAAPPPPPETVAVEEEDDDDLGGDSGDYEEEEEEEEDDGYDEFDENEDEPFEILGDAEQVRTARPQTNAPVN